MMIRSVPSDVNSLLSRRTFQSDGRSASPTITCCSRNRGYVPKLEPFSRSKFDRVLKDPPLIQKTENELADYCSTLEGDPCYNCWTAYFELEELEKELPKKEVERLILQTEGLKSLIGSVHSKAGSYKARKQLLQNKKESTANNWKTDKVAAEEERSCPVPDGIPKSQQEMEEEERDRMPESSFTRLLRSKGRFPAWYTPRPDHETD